MNMFVFCFSDAQALLGLATGHELEPLVIQEDTDISHPTPTPRRKSAELPTFETTTEVDDNLNDVRIKFYLKLKKKKGVLDLLSAYRSGRQLEGCENRFLFKI
jgi:hypothetical protein